MPSTASSSPTPNERSLSARRQDLYPEQVVALKPVVEYTGPVPQGIRLRDGMDQSVEHRAARLTVIRGGTSRHLGGRPDASGVS